MNESPNQTGDVEAVDPVSHSESGRRAASGTAWWPGPARDPAAQEKTPKELRTFAIVVAVPLTVLGGYLSWKGQWAGSVLLGASVLLLAAGAVAPRALAPVERAWMRLAHVLSVVSTYVILTLTFFVIITPVGFLVRRFGHSGISLGPEQGRASYWEPVEPGGPSTRPDKPF